MAWLDLEAEIRETFEGLARFDRAGLRSGFRTTRGPSRKRGDRRAERLRALERVRARRADARAGLAAARPPCPGCGGAVTRPTLTRGAVPRYCSDDCCRRLAAKVTNERRKAARARCTS